MTRWTSSDAPASRAPHPVEARARMVCGSSDVARAITMLLEAYGPELLGFLRWLLNDTARGDDVFSDLAIDAWRGLSGFDWRCSARTWLYKLARRAAARYARARRNRAMAHLSDTAISALVARLRTETAPYLRTDVKQEVGKLRERLPVDDQVLLVLRVDKRMSWREITLIMAEEGLREADTEVLEARLRKRFQSAKERLRKLAEESGLLPR